MIKIIRIKLQLEIERDGDSFHAYCPALKGLHVDGSTEREAIEVAEQAASAYIISMIDHDEPLPVGCNVSDFRLGVFDRLRKIVWSRRHLITTEVICAA